MAGPLLIDTDVLIDYLRGQAELHVGVREGDEREVLERFLGLLEAVDITPDIVRQAGLWRRDFGKSHGTGLMDAPIAASAELSGSTLVTLNGKHYPMLESVLVPYRKS